jgi:DNA primase
MKHEQITYPEALRWLAKKYNIEIEERELTAEEKQQQTERESMFIVNEWACQYFHEILKNDVDGQAIGKQYFRSRGIRDDIIEKFMLGFALTKRDAMANEARRKGYKDEFLVKTGLCYVREANTQQPSSNTQLIDRFAGRAIFPWLNVSGKVVAFGGRKLDAATKGVQQKYVNSPESEIYHKERELYGIYQAKRAIVKEDRVFMVEGYTDVIAMHQAGIENVVANSGTALSVHQIHMLHRFTNNITLLYDGDEAGIHAAMRGTDMLLSEGMNIKVLLLPDGDDPDSFARKHSSEELRNYIENEQTDFISFKTRLTVENQTDPVKRSEAISGIVKSISVIPDPILRSTYITDFAQRIGMKEQTLIASLNKNIRQNTDEQEKERERNARRDAETEAAKSAGSVAPEPLTRHTPQEQSSLVATMLIREIIRHGEEIIYDDVETDDGQKISFNVAQYISYDLGQDGLSFANPLYNQVLDEAVAHSGEPGFKAEQYFTNHPDINISHLATQQVIDRHQLGGRFAVQPREGSLRQRVLHLVMDFRLDIVEARLKEIQQQLRQASSDMSRVMELMKQYKETQELRDLLARKLGSDLVVG